MKILHILKDGPSTLSSKVAEAQAKDNEVKVIDLSKKEASYDTVVDAIFANDKVICW